MESWTCWKTEGAIRVKQNVVRLGNFLGGQHVFLECGDQKLKVFAGRGLGRGGRGLSGSCLAMSQ